MRRATPDPSSSHDKPRVRIHVNGRVAGVKPIVTRLMAPLLVTRHLAYEEGGPSGVTSRVQRDPHALGTKDDQLIIQAGLTSKVASVLEKHGHEVEIIDSTEPRPRVELDATVLGKLLDEESAFVRAVMANRHGQILAPRLEDRVAQAAAAARAFPEAVISYIVTSRSGARKFHKQLSSRLHEPVALQNEGGYVHSYTRLLVGTGAGLDPDIPDIIIFIKAAEAIAKQFDPYFERFTNQHVLGFVSGTEQLGARERLRLEARLGPVVFAFPGPMGAPAQVRVLVAESPTTTPPSRSADSLERKRQVVWHNDRRNAAVAAIAEALATGRPDDLYTYGLGLDGVDHLAGITNPRVAVLVESPEHGRALARRLTAWSFLTYTGRTGEPAPGGAVDAVGSPGTELEFAL